jgi:hypothetical protein
MSDERLSWAEGIAQDTELKRDLILEAQLHGAYLDSGKIPMIFGYKIGQNGLTDELYFRAMERLTPEQIDDFIKGFAHAVAMADLQLSAFDPLRDDSARNELARLEDLAYQYFKGVQEYVKRER